MIYRIIATIVLVAAIVAVGVALEPGSGSQHQSTKPAQSIDDGAMKSLRIN